jgi:hypothetical protein
MEKRNLMLSLLGLNALFYLSDLLIIYKKFFDKPEKYAGVFNFEIFYSFLFSLFLMVPTLMSYFTLFNFLKEQERTQLVGNMLMITLINLGFVALALFYVYQA